MRILGLILIAISLALPLIWFVPLVGKHDALAIFSQYLGTVALIGMAIGQLLAIRRPILEPVFGGLDQVYVIHKWLGIGALATMVLHDIIDADVQGVGPETWLSDLAETLGEISLYGIIALILITLITFVPYHLWRWTHKLMGAFFVLGAFHFAFILKPFQNGEPLGLYTLAFCAIGTLAYIWTLLPFPFAHGKYRYKIDAIDETGGAMAITLSPQNKGLQHRAGQFAFIRVEDGETHPFTISKAPTEDRSLRFTVKPLGDDTKRFAHLLKAGQLVQISSAFGHFRGAPKPKQIWVAGGIGITPFMALAESLGDETVTLFYCVKSRDDAPHLASLEAIAAAKPNFTLRLMASSEGKRLDMADIGREIDALGDGTHLYYCGPDRLREAIQATLPLWGVSARQFHYEAFEIRSGIGLRKFMGWVLSKIAPKISPRLNKALNR